MRTCLTLLTLLATPPLHAAPVPIPADALAVVQLNGRGPAVDHLAQFLAGVQPEAAKDLPQRLRKIVHNEPIAAGEHRHLHLRNLPARHIEVQPIQKRRIFPNHLRQRRKQIRISRWM